MTKEEIKGIPQCPGIYMLKNIINEKCYIGQSIQLRKRLNQHYKNANNDRFIGKHLYDSMNKYGIENFKITILETLDPFTNVNIIKELNKLEIYYIAKFKSFKYGYNETKGGESELGCNHSPEIAAKISKALKIYFEKNREKLNGTFYTLKETYGYNIKEKYFINSFSRSELSRLLKEEKGISINVSEICKVILNKAHSSKGFVFGNTKEECLEKLKFFDTQEAKHSPELAPNYKEYLEYLKSICDKFGYLPKIEDIAKHYNRARTTIVGWNKHISKYIELDEYYNRLKLKDYTNPNIDYKLRETRQMYLIYDTINNVKYILNTLEMSKFFNLTRSSTETLIKRNTKTNKLYRKQYLISICNGDNI